jgi:hypothetical protein
VIQVYQAENIIDAQLICDRLIDGGIEAEVHGEFLSGAVGELPADTTIGVWIRHHRDRQRALELTRNFEAERRQTLPCYECGNCGERVEGNYSLCWNCGGQLGDPQ